MTEGLYALAFFSPSECEGPPAKRAPTAYWDIDFENLPSWFFPLSGSHRPSCDYCGCSKFKDGLFKTGYFKAATGALRNCPSISHVSQKQPIAEEKDATHFCLLLLHHLKIHPPPPRLHVTHYRQLWSRLLLSPVVPYLKN